MEISRTLDIAAIFEVPFALRGRLEHLIWYHKGCVAYIYIYVTGEMVLMAGRLQSLEQTHM